MNHLLVLRGHPASGKSTLGRELERLGAGRFIDHNYLLKVVRAMSGDDEGVYLELSRLEAAICRAHLAEGRSAIIDGPFTTAGSLMPLARVAEEASVPLVVVRLDVSVRTLRRRVVAPDRAEDAPELMAADILDRWLAEHPFQPWYGEHVLSGEGEAAALARGIRKLLA